MEPATQCSYIGCDKPGRKGRRFHFLPAENSTLSVKWLINSGREDLLTYESNVLQSMKLAICSDHFHDDDYDDVGNLKKNTVPLQYWDLGYSCELGEIREEEIAAHPFNTSDDSFTTIDSEADENNSDINTDDKFQSRLSTKHEASLNSEADEMDSDFDTDDEFRTQLGREIEALLNSVQMSHRQSEGKKKQDVGHTLRNFYKKLNLKGDRWSHKNQSGTKNFIEFKKLTQNMCRTCAKNKNNLVDITDKTTRSDIDIRTKLKLLIEIKDHDVLPTKICRECLAKLERAYKFFQQIYKADNVLHDMFVNIEPQSEAIFDNKKNNGHIGHFTHVKTQRESEMNNGNGALIRDNSFDNGSNGSDDAIRNGNTTDKASVNNEICTSEYPENTVSYLLSEYCNNDAELNWLDVLGVMERKEAKDKLKTNKSAETLTVGPLQIPCRYCNKSFKLRRQLKTHITVDHLQQTNYMCEYCNICCKSKENLAEHQAGAHSKHKYKCDECGELFCKKVELQLHIERIHSADNNVTKVFNADTNRHLVSHLDQTFACNDCDETFASKKTLSNHIHRLHPPFAYTCTICNEVMHSEADTYKHMSMHDKSPLFPCLECGRMFYNTERLAKHINTHYKSTSNKKKRVWFHCQICDASYRLADELINHIETHSSQDWENYRNKILYCGECNARLIGNDKFRVHKMRYHLAKRGDFICLLCDQVTKDFQSLREYEKHVNMHSNELKRSAPRRYKCEHCDKAFKSNSHRINHIDSFHSDVMHSCPICNLKVKRKGNLKDHIDRVHGSAKQQSIIERSNSEINSKLSDGLKTNLVNQNENDVISNKCEYSETVFENEDSRENHKLNYHRNNSKRFKLDSSNND